MKNAKHDLLLPILKIFNAILLTVPFGLVWYFVYSNEMASPYYIKGQIIVLLLFFLLYSAMCKTFDGFTVSISPVTEMVYSQMLAAVISDFFMYIVIFLLIRSIPNVLWMLVIVLGQFVLALCWCFCANHWYFRSFSAKRAIVIYDMRQGLSGLFEEYKLTRKFDVFRELPVEECFRDFSIIDQAEVVFLSDIHSHERNIILKYCLERSIDVYVIPRIGDVVMSGAKPIHLFHLPVLRATRYNPNPFYLALKRVFDIVVAGLGLIVLSPIFIVTAIAVKSDGGPAFYKQERLTKDGKHFFIHKFRSMCVDAEKDGVARLSTGEKDSRITPVGRIIRKCRIDELPQLIDVIKGDLSIVGPRPERPEIAEQYCREMPEFRMRLQAKAGLTGYAQVYGKYNTTPYDKLLMDLTYIAHPSFVEDLRICFATVKILFMPESTEGVAEGQTTAASSSAGNTDGGKDENE